MESLNKEMPYAINSGLEHVIIEQWYRWAKITLKPSSLFELTKKVQLTINDVSVNNL
jgi:hypothetical protein